MMKPPPSAHGFFVKRLGADDYRIGWTVAKLRSGVALPTAYTEQVDRAHAAAFAREHGLELPPEPRRVTPNRRARRKRSKREHR